MNKPANVAYEKEDNLPLLINENIRHKNGNLRPLLKAELIFWLVDQAVKTSYFQYYSVTLQPKLLIMMSEESNKFTAYRIDLIDS